MLSFLGNDYSFTMFWNQNPQTHCIDWYTIGRMISMLTNTNTIRMYCIIKLVCITQTSCARTKLQRKIAQYNTKNAMTSMHQLVLPLSNTPPPASHWYNFPFYCGHIVFKNPHRNEDKMIVISRCIQFHYGMWHSNLIWYAWQYDSNNFWIFSLL